MIAPPGAQPFTIVAKLHLARSQQSAAQLVTETVWMSVQHQRALRNRDSESSCIVNRLISIATCFAPIEVRKEAGNFVWQALALWSFEETYFGGFSAFLKHKAIEMC